MSAWLDGSTALRRASSFINDAFDVRIYEAACDGVTDDTAAVIAAAAAASAEGGGLVTVPSGTCCISGSIVLPPNVDIRGQGKKSTIFKCLAPGAQLAFGPPSGLFGYGGMSGSFTVDGNALATTPIQVGQTVQRSFIDILSTGAVGSAWNVSQAQNCAFVGCDGVSSAYGITLDLGAGGNVFYRCEFDSNTTTQAYITETGTASHLVYTIPTHNKFDHCIFEIQAAAATATSCVSLDAGSNNFFDDCVFATSSGIAADIPCVAFSNGAFRGDAPSITHFNGSIFFGATVSSTKYGYGIEHSGAFCDIYLTGTNTFINLNAAFHLGDSARVHVDNSIFKASVTNDFVSNGGAFTADDLITLEIARRVNITRTNATDRALGFYKAGAGQWMQATADGKFQWGDGSGFTFDTNLYRSAANTLRTDDALKVQATTTAARPSAATLGVSAQIFDLTLKCPIWSDGANWVNGAGAVV